MAEVLKDFPEVSYVIVNESGASVYSASELARQEFPDLTVEKRSAISIARRLQDPLAELVKIDPKSIGVGQYQHDVSQKKLSESLTLSWIPWLTKSVSISTQPAQLFFSMSLDSTKPFLKISSNTVRKKENHFTRPNQEGSSSGSQSL